jgi:hypothetical protein
VLTGRVLSRVGSTAAAAAALAAAEGPCAAAGRAGACVSTALLSKRRERRVVALIGEGAHIEDQHIALDVPGLRVEG